MNDTFDILDLLYIKSSFFFSLAPPGSNQGVGEFLLLLLLSYTRQGRYFCPNGVRNFDGIGGPRLKRWSCIFRSRRLGHRPSLSSLSSRQGPEDSHIALD